MAYFRLYVLNDKNRQITSMNLNADHKLAAIETARGLMIPDSLWFAFELWQNARQVHKELRSDFDLLCAPTPVERSVTYLKMPKRAQND